MSIDSNISVGDIVQITGSLGCIPLFLSYKSYCEVIDSNYRGRSDYILVKTLDGMEITQMINKAYVNKVNLSEDELSEYCSKEKEFTKYILHNFGVDQSV